MTWWVSPLFYLMSMISLDPATGTCCHKHSTRTTSWWPFRLTNITCASNIIHKGIHNYVYCREVAPTWRMQMRQSLWQERLALLMLSLGMDSFFILVFHSIYIVSLTLYLVRSIEIQIWRGYPSQKVCPICGEMQYPCPGQAVPLWQGIRHGWSFPDEEHIWNADAPCNGPIRCSFCFYCRQSCMRSKKSSHASIRNIHNDTQSHFSFFIKP